MNAAVLFLAMLGQVDQAPKIRGLAQAVQFAEADNVRKYQEGSVIEIPVDLPVLPPDVEQSRKYRIDRPAGVRPGRLILNDDGNAIKEMVCVWGLPNTRQLPTYELICEITTVDWVNRKFVETEMRLLIQITRRGPPDEPDPIDPDKPDQPDKPVDPDKPEPTPEVPTDRFDNVGKRVAAEGKRQQILIGSDYARVYRETARLLSDGQKIWNDARQDLDREIAGLVSGTPPAKAKYAAVNSKIITPTWEKFITREEGVDGISEYLLAVAAGFDGI